MAAFAANVSRRIGFDWIFKNHRVRISINNSFVGSRGIVTLVDNVRIRNDLFRFADLTAGWLYHGEDHGPLEYDQLPSAGPGRIGNKSRPLLPLGVKPALGEYARRHPFGHGEQVILLIEDSLRFPEGEKRHNIGSHFLPLVLVADFNLPSIFPGTA